MKKQQSNQKYFNRNKPPLSINCECGGDAKLRTRVNYSFGKKSKKVVKKFYKCNKCDKIIKWL